MLGRYPLNIHDIRPNLFLDRDRGLPRGENRVILQNLMDPNRLTRLNLSAQSLRFSGIKPERKDILIADYLHFGTFRQAVRQMDGVLMNATPPPRHRAYQTDFLYRFADW
jgi:hypothetical protein